MDMSRYEIFRMFFFKPNCNSKNKPYNVEVDRVKALQNKIDTRYTRFFINIFQAEMLLMHDHNRVDGPGVALEPQGAMKELVLTS